MNITCITSEYGVNGHFHTVRDVPITVNAVAIRAYTRTGVGDGRILYQAKDASGTWYSFFKRDNPQVRKIKINWTGATSIQTTLTGYATFSQEVAVAA